MKPFLIIIKTLIIGYLWTVVFIDGIRVVLLINWHFDIFLKRHWGLLAEKWDSGDVISNSEMIFYVILISSIPLWAAGWFGLCIVKWKKTIKNILLSPIYLFRALMLKRKAPTVKKKSIINGSEPIKKVAVIKKDKAVNVEQKTGVAPSQPAAMPMPSANMQPVNVPGSVKNSLPSATLLKSNINTQPTTNSASSYQVPKKRQEAPTDHALFNFTEDDFDFDFDFEKKEPKETLDNSIPSALVVEKSEKNNVPQEPEKKEQPKAKKNNQEKENNSQARPQAKKEAPKNKENPAPAKESHTPVLDILVQRGYDIISAPIIKKTKIDYIAVSKDKLLLCLVDKEVGEWLADEEKFNDEEPLWFSESSHRISPVRKIDIARDILKSKLAVADFNFEIVSYVIIQSGHIINAEDMVDVWSELDVNVTRINRGEPKMIRLFSKSIEAAEEKIDPAIFEKLKKLIYSIA